MPLPLSILDLAPVAARADRGRAASRRASSWPGWPRRAGYTRVWYAEHHNMPSIASSATSVLIAHVAAHTERIRLGSGGVMLPNHAPLVIAEQFGTLAALHPGPHRPRPGPRARHRPDHAAGTAARGHRGRRLPARRTGTAGLSGRRVARRGCQRIPRPRLRRASLHPRLVAVRRPAGRAVRAAVRVRLTLRAGRPAARRRCLPPRLPAVAPARGAARDRRGERDRRRIRGRRGRAVPARPCAQRLRALAGPDCSFATNRSMPC